jgi:hypothetical protein
VAKDRRRCVCHHWFVLVAQIEISYSERARAGSDLERMPARQNPVLFHFVSNCNPM